MPDGDTQRGHLAFDDTGDGDAPPVVLLHGWCCDRAALAPQRAAFAARYRVISVDLPGHGASPGGARDYGIAAQADEVAALCARLALAPAILIGHSMGGAVALELAATRPARVAALVALDTSILPPAATRQAWATLLARLDEADHRRAAREAIERAYFLPYDDPARRTALAAAMSATPRDVMRGTLRGILAWDGARAAAALRAPFLYIGSSAPHCDLARLAELCPQLVRAQVAAAGHFIQLEVPEQVNAMIARFLRVVVGSGKEKAERGTF